MARVKMQIRRCKSAPNVEEALNIMYSINLRLFKKLDEEDQEKVAYFLKLLIDQAKYRKTKAELMERRREVENGEVLTHEEIWKQLNI